MDQVPGIQGFSPRELFLVSERRTDLGTRTAPVDTRWPLVRPLVLDFVWPSLGCAAKAQQTGANPGTQG